MIEKIKLYFYGIWLALRGKYPHEELAQFNHLKIRIYEDNKWLCVHPVTYLLTSRYNSMISSDWRKISYTNINLLREQFFTAIHNHYKNEAKK